MKPFAARLRFVAVASASFLALAISGAWTATAAVAQETATPEAASVAAYLDSAVAITRAHVLGRDTVDWDAFRDSLSAWAAPGEELADAHWALARGLRRLNPHSFLSMEPERMIRMVMRHSSPETRPVAQGRRRVLSPFSDRDTPSGALVEAEDGRRIGHVAIPSFGGDHGTEFADSIEALVRDLHTRGACGWIVDLRGNGGGNMWPMLAGIGPVLGEGTVGYFVEASGDTTGAWFYRGGAAGISAGWGEGGILARVSAAPTPYRMAGTPPVAVLYDGGTMSSGEAVAIAFSGRPDTRSFGVASGGFATGNSTFTLPDSATLVLTTTFEADRNGVVYPVRLHPDEVVPIAAGDEIPEEPPVEDPQIAAALSWLLRQPGCDLAN